jgi:hypothetical protein
LRWTTHTPRGDWPLQESYMRIRIHAWVHGLLLLLPVAPAGPCQWIPNDIFMYIAMFFSFLKVDLELRIDCFFRSEFSTPHVHLLYLYVLKRALSLRILACYCGRSVLYATMTDGKLDQGLPFRKNRLCCTPHVNFLLIVIKRGSSLRILAIHDEQFLQLCRSASSANLYY